MQALISGINVDILKYGVIGLSFLLAFLAYKLLKEEQNKEIVRSNILKSVNVFMVFSIVLSCIGLVAEFGKNNTNNENTVQIESLKEERNKYRTELKNVSSIVGELIKAKVGLVDSLPDDIPSVKPIKLALKSLDKSVTKTLK